MQIPFIKLSYRFVNNCQTIIDLNFCLMYSVCIDLAFIMFCYYENIHAYSISSQALSHGCTSHCFHSNCCYYATVTMIYMFI